MQFANSLHLISLTEHGIEILSINVPAIAYFEIFLSIDFSAKLLLYWHSYEKLFLGIISTISGTVMLSMEEFWKARDEIVFISE